MSYALNRSLCRNVAQTFVIAYKENTQILEKTLENQGFHCEVLRQVHQPEYKHYSPSYLCLLNHCQAWKRASESKGLTLVMEADFVPVKRMGQLPLPVNPDKANVGIAWLYTCAPQLFSVSEDGYAQGFSASTVAYLITPASAIALLKMADGIRTSPGPYAYSAWDSEIAGFLRDHQFENFIPRRNYGEHGGLPNPEHRQYGLSATHRADVLYGTLAFTPPYAALEQQASRSWTESFIAGLKCRYCYFSTRLQARLKGLGRLLLGKFLRGKVVRGSSVPTWLLWFAIQRQFSWPL